MIPSVYPFEKENELVDSTSLEDESWVKEKREKKIDDVYKHATCKPSMFRR